MHRHMFLIAVLAFWPFLCHAQAHDTIQVYRNWLGQKRLAYEGRKLGTMRKISEVIRQDPEAMRTLRRAKWATRVGIPMTYASAFLNLALFLQRSDAFYVSVGGTLLIEVSGALYSSQQQWRAVRIFNNDMRRTAYDRNIKPSLFCGLTGNGIGVGLSF